MKRNQYVAIYDSTDRRGIVYDTVYSAGQAADARARCAAAHGSCSFPRIVPAAKHPPA